MMMMMMLILMMMKMMMVIDDDHDVGLDYEHDYDYYYIYIYIYLYVQQYVCCVYGNSLPCPYPPSGFGARVPDGCEGWGVTSKVAFGQQCPMAARGARFTAEPWGPARLCTISCSHTQIHDEDYDVDDHDDE